MIPLQNQRWNQVIISNQVNVVENQMKNPLNKEKQGLEKKRKRQGTPCCYTILKLQRKRTLETSEQRKACLERQRLTYEQTRAVGSEENRQTCLERQRFTNEQSKNTVSKEHWQTRLEKQRITNEQRRSAESEEHRQRQQRTLDQERLGKQTEEQRQVSLEHDYQQHGERRTRHLQDPLID